MDYNRKYWWNIDYYIRTAAIRRIYRKWFRKRKTIHPLNSVWSWMLK